MRVFIRFTLGHPQEGGKFIGSGDELHAELEAAVLKHLLQQFDQKPTRLARALQMNRATLLKKRPSFGMTAADGPGCRGGL